MKSPFTATDIENKLNLFTCWKDYFAPDYSYTCLGVSRSVTQLSFPHKLQKQYFSPQIKSTFWSFSSSLLSLCSPTPLFLTFSNLCIILGGIYALLCHLLQGFSNQHFHLASYIHIYLPFFLFVICNSRLSQCMLSLFWVLSFFFVKYKEHLLHKCNLLFLILCCASSTTPLHTYGSWACWLFMMRVLCNINRHVSQIQHLLISPLFSLPPPVDSSVWRTGAPSWRRWYQCQLHGDPEPRPVCCRPQCWQWSLGLPTLPGCQWDRGHALRPTHQ